MRCETDLPKLLKCPTLSIDVHKKFTNTTFLYKIIPLFFEKKFGYKKASLLLINQKNFFKVTIFL